MADELEKLKKELEGLRAKVVELDEENTSLAHKADSAEDAADEAEDRADKSYEQLEEAQAENRKLRAAILEFLRKMEWSTGRCPVCMAGKPAHVVGCELRLTIAALDMELVRNR